MKDPRGLLKRSETRVEKGQRLDAALSHLFNNRIMRTYSAPEIAEFCGVDQKTIANVEYKAFAELRLLLGNG